MHRALQLNIYELLCSPSRLAWTVKGCTWTWIQVWKNKTEMRIHRFPLLTRRVTQQTGKGEIHRRSVLVVIGNGDGLVGYGEAKHDDGACATKRAFAMGVRNMDYVDRFEGQTIWTEMSSKLGATRIILRPRPVGFSLHRNPNIHQVLKAAGIKTYPPKYGDHTTPSTS